MKNQVSLLSLMANADHFMINDPLKQTASWIDIQPKSLSEIPCDSFLIFTK